MFSCLQLMKAVESLFPNLSDVPPPDSLCLFYATAFMVYS